MDGKTNKDFIHIRIDHNSTYSLGGGKHTNGIESCRAVLKRSVYGIFHHISVKHLYNVIKC
ncbi:MAG: transposase [Paludibacteraceae bacterium]|nr:transposase [Paludibacteraceae bacterium]